MLPSVAPRLATDSAVRVFRDKYLKMFPKPYRKEDVWKQIDLTDAFKMEDKVAYDLKYEFSLDEFVDFMMI